MAAQPISPDDLFTETGAGIYLGGEKKPVRPATMRRWRWAGKGPAYLKIGGIIRYTRRDLDAEKTAARREPQRVTA